MMWIIVAIIAGLTDIQHPIAANLRRAIGPAAISRRCISVVASFRAFDYAVATSSRLYHAIFITPISRDEIAVVTRLAQVEDSVAASFHSTVCTTTISTRGVSVIAGFASFENSVTTEC